MGSESHSESDSSEYIKHKEIYIYIYIYIERERERERERENISKAIYTNSSYNLGVVQYPCTFKWFHYHYTRLQLFNETTNILLNAQAYKQEISNAHSKLKETSKCLQVNKFISTLDIPIRGVNNTIQNKL